MRFRQWLESVKPVKYGRVRSKYFKNVLYVPIENMYKYGEAENILVGGPNGRNPDSYIVQLAKDIEMYGYETPLSMIMDRWDTAHPDKFVPVELEKVQRAYLSDGGHRLAASKMLGYTHVPVQVNDGDVDRLPNRYGAIPASQMPPLPNEPSPLPEKQGRWDLRQQKYQSARNQSI